MKNILVSAILLSSSMSLAAVDVLLKQNTSSGFGMGHPSSSELQVLSDGNVIETKTIVGKSSKVKIAKLSASAVANIKNKIEETSETAELVDENPDAPKCMDGPHSSQSIIKNGNEVVITSRHSCHEEKMQDYNATSLSMIIDGLDELTN